MTSLGAPPQPWVHSRWFDLLFLLSPPFICVSLLLVFHARVDDTTLLPLWAWVVFILGIDVSHVYSTLFRTYFHAEEFAENRTLLTLLPLAVWACGVVIYSFGAGVFWTILAYLAVFHFVRQQYGLMKIYSRRDSALDSTHESTLARRLDTLVIYVVTLYPIIYWHAHLPRNFHWFVDGDFFTGLPVWCERLAFGLYLFSIVTYCLKEVWLYHQSRIFNLPKNLIVSGTALSWYVGIVHFNGDIAFTISNVVTHGIPYIALVWAHGRKTRTEQWSTQPVVARILSWSFTSVGAIAFFGVLLLLGYLEEGLWAGLVWREHFEVFGLFKELPTVTDRATLMWLVPLLSLPQATHYALDGFIWKLKNTEAAWHRILFRSKEALT